MPYNMLDFNNFDSIISFGERVAQQHYDEIKALADSLNAIEYKPLKSYTTVPLDSVEISQVHFTGLERMRPNYLENLFGEFRNSKVAVSDLEDVVRYAYGSGFFNAVFYEFQYSNGITNLLVKVKESERGTLAAGLHYDTDYLGSILVNLSLKNVLGRRSKLFLDLVLGRYPMLRGRYIIDNDVKPGIGLDFNMFSFGFDAYTGNTKENSFNFDNLGTSLFIPITIRNKYAFRAGFEYQYFRFRQDIAIDTSITGYDSYSGFGNLYFQFGVDTRDKPYFSTKGAFAKLKGLYTLPLSKDWNQELFDNTFTIYLRYDQYIPLSRKFSLNAKIFAGGSIENTGLITLSSLSEKLQNATGDERNLISVPIQNQFFVGGLNQYNYMDTFVPFVGMRFIQSQGVYIGILGLDLQYNFLKDLYVTAMFNAGQNSIVLDSFLNWDLFWDEDYRMLGYGMKLSYNSFIGPVEGSVMWSSQVSGAIFFLNVGFWL
ncbi:MAG: hypothetical protein P8100_11610 [bacterium]